MRFLKRFSTFPHRGLCSIISSAATNLDFLIDIKNTLFKGPAGDCYCTLKIPSVQHLLKKRHLLHAHIWSFMKIIISGGGNLCCLIDKKNPQRLIVTSNDDPFVSVRLLKNGKVYVIPHLMHQHTGNGCNSQNLQIFS